jgi:hypothetical protein
MAEKMVTHFDFVSWHPISPRKFHAAARVAARDRVTPTAVLKKAIPEGMAHFASHTLSGILREPMPGTTASHRLC